MTKTGGRQVEVGIGIEATPGTAVSATGYFKWDTFTMQSMADKIMLNSSRGIRNKASNSIINKKYGKGSIDFVPNVNTLPYILSLAMGSKSTATHSGESAVYDHTFTIQNANASMKTATILVKQGGVQTERYSNCVTDTLNLTFDKDFSKCAVNLLSGFPDTGSISSSYTQDTLFTKNDMVAIFGTSLSNATGTHATTTLTSNATNATDGGTVTIGSIVYTFKTALTNNGYTPYEVLLGSTAALTLDNLKAAINATGTAGTTYGYGTLAHPDFTATTNTDTTQLIQAKVSGTTPNSVATTSTDATLSWTGTTVNSGTPGTGPNPTALINFSLNLNNGVLFEDAFLSGSNEPVAGGYLSGPLQIKGSYTLQFADVVELAKYQANTKNALIVTVTGAAIGSVPSSEQIIIKIGRIVLDKAPLEYQIDGLVYLKQEFEVEYDATDKELTVVVTNGADGTNY